MTLILHITERSAWQEAWRQGTYAPPSLGVEGFIHCSTVEQVVATANAFFRGTQGLVLLLIDEGVTTSAIRYESPAGGGVGLFPHVYGPLNVEAVVAVFDFPCSADGTFTLPDGVVVR